MKFLKVKSLNKNQQGFLLIEVLGALVIASLISLAVTMANAQVLNQTSHNNNYTTASQQTQNAIYWIGRDVQMAQTINGTDGFPQTKNLVLSWKTWDNSVHTANYTLVNSELQRTYVIDAGSPTITVVAEYINSGEGLTYCTSDNGVVTLKITSSVGEGSETVDVTKIHQITSRPNL
jgi:type II secretory pathway component PulJ